MQKLPKKYDFFYENKHLYANAYRKFKQMDCKFLKTY